MVGLGIDSVEVARFELIAHRRPSVLARVLTPGELAYCSAQRYPAASAAVRFAAKEAVMKALSVGLGALDWHDVEVVRAPSGAPSLAVGGRAADLAAAVGGGIGVGGWWVSLTHTATLAIAVVVATAAG